MVTPCVPPADFRGARGQPDRLPLQRDADRPYWVDWLDTAVGDLNGDAHNDVVVGRNGALEIFHQSGGVLQTPIVITTAGPVEGVAVADLNGDGAGDLVYTVDIGNHQFALTRQFQGAAGAFGTATVIATTDRGRLDVGDVNTDGRPDIVMNGYGTVGTQIFLHNQANQGFTESLLSIDSVVATAVADVNGDGRNDLLALQSYQLWMAAGTAGGGLAAPVSLDSNVYLGSGVAAVDMNADTRSDVVLFSQGGLDVRLADRGGDAADELPIPEPTQAAPAGYLSDVAIGDLDGDGRPDAAAAELDDFTRAMRQSAPGSSVPTSLSISPPSTAEIGTPFSVAGTMDGGISGCLGANAVDVWRTLPGGSPTLIGTAALTSYGPSQWYFSYTDDPGVLGSVEYQVTWAGDEFRDPSQSSVQLTDVTNARRCSIFCDRRIDQGG